MLSGKRHWFSRSQFMTFWTSDFWPTEINSSVWVIVSILPRHEWQLFEPTYSAWPIHKQLQCLHVSEGYKYNLTSIPHFENSPKASLVAKGWYFIWGAWPVPVRETLFAMRQIVFSRHLTWIAALPPYRSGPPCPLYSHIYPLVSTSDSRGGVHLNSSCRCERRGNLDPYAKQSNCISYWIGN